MVLPGVALNDILRPIPALLFYSSLSNAFYCAVFTSLPLSVLDL